jgi:bla regulator protein blaR1
VKRIWLVFLLAGTGFSQGPPAFDAVSIKPSSPDARGGGFNMSPGRLNGKNVNLKDLVRFAYDIHDYQLSGGLGWTETEHYEVLATCPADTTKAQRAQMLQTMLADRFALVIHHEPKDVAGYALTVSKNGAKLHPPEDPQQGMMLGRSPTTGQRTLHGTSATTSDVAGILADLLGKPVEDDTALAGKFDFSMEWTPDAVSEVNLRKGSGPQEALAGDQTGPTIFTALQEQLGLKLETKKLPVAAIAIDHAEKPSAN